MTDEQETCPICTEALCDNKHTLECKHSFHTSCIIEWFRKGSASCPICRNKGDESKNLSYFDVQTRCSYLRRKAKTKNAPKELKRIYKKLKKAEEKEKQVKKTLREFEKDYNELRKKYRKLRSKRWSASRSVDKAKRLLGLFEDPNYPIPVVVPRPRKRFRY